jgi:hypothetical protein
MVTTRRKPSMMNEAMANGNAKKSVEDGHGPAVDPKRRRITFDSDETVNNSNEDSSSSLSIPSVINTAAIKKKKGKKKKGDDDLSSSSTPISIELQKIVDTMPLSRDALGKIKDLMRHSVMDQCLTALKKVYDLTNTQDETIMKNFIKHEGVSKVIAFLKLAVDDGNTSPGKEIQTKCFEVAADVLFNVCSCSPFDDAVKQWNRKKNAMDIIEHDGVRILLLAHRELKQKGEQYPLCNLDAAKSIWSLISLLSNGGNFTILAKERVRALFDLGVELVNDMKYTKLSKGVDIMGDVFETMKHIIVFNNEESGAKGIVTGRDIEESNILSECCIMFRKNSTISRSTDAVEQVIAFLYYSHCRELFKNASDYEKILPICLLGVAMGPLLRMKFRKRTMMIIYKACMLVDKKKIKRASVKKIFTDLIISPSTEIDEEDERDVFPPLVHYYGDIINQIEEKESGDEGGDEKSEDEEEW